METLSQTATLVIVGGPDRGGLFRLAEEMVHVGRGPDKQVPLTDSEAAEHVASICNRSGRFALYALTDTVLIDDSPVPPERWVWLPETARIRLTPRTLVQFTAGTGASVEEENGAAPPKLPGRPAAPPSRPKPAKGTASRVGSKKGGSARESTVARFIVDQQGDTLVKLGEDGQLPELRLSEGPQTKPAERQRSGANPVLVYGAVAFSFVFSILLLLVDASPSSTSERERADARRQIADFYGEGNDLRPYQRLLREAKWARARGDYDAEERAYRDVLALLNSEDYNGGRKASRTAALTGDPRSDERLRELIAILLSR